MAYLSGSQAGAFEAGGGSSGNPVTAVSSVTAGRWHIAIFVWASAASRSVYIETDTTGATNTTSLTTTGLDRIHCAVSWDGSSPFNGEIGPIWILSGDLSGAGNANLRAAIFAGSDPVKASKGVATLIAHYPMKDASGASQSGLYDLTPSGTPTATNRLLVVRDQSGNNRHVRATTSAPTYSTSQGNGQGGGAFASASSQFLVFDGSVPTAAPLQVFAVGQSSSASAAQGAAWLGDKDGTADFWSLFFAGATSGDPLGWRAMRGSAADAVTSAGYSVSTNYVLWALESSATTRAAQINGGSQGTNSTSTSPATADRFGLGGWLDSTPSNFLDGQIHYVILLTTASTHAKSRIEKFLAGAFGITLS